MYRLNYKKSKYKEGYNDITGIVNNISFDGYKLKLEVKGKEKILVYCNSNLNVGLGDKVQVKGNLEKTNKNTNFNTFNYRNYMLSYKIQYKIKSNEIKVLKKNRNIFFKVKSFIIKRISKLKSFHYLKAFILGDTSSISKVYMESYIKNGLSHLFSISGMHIALLSGIVLLILNKFKIKYYFTILFLVFYAFIANFSKSIIRSTLMFIFMFFQQKLNLKLSKFKILIIILCVILMFNPYNIYNVGFQFSYIISIYIIIFNGLINRQKNYISKILMTSIISFLASIPILINNYFSINLMTILNNIVFVPFISMIIFPLSFLVLLFPKLDIVYNNVIKILENLSLFFGRFRIEIILCKTNIIITVIYYLVVYIVLYKVYKKKYNYVILIVIIIFIHSNIKYFRDNKYVTFLDANQGDSAFIHLSNNNGNILIDIGGYNTSNNVIEYFKSEGIGRINYFILTHGDYDHMGEAVNLVNNFKVDNVIFNCGEFNDLEKELIRVLNNKKIKYYSCIRELNIGTNKLYFLNNKDYGNENDNKCDIMFIGSD